MKKQRISSLFFFKNRGRVQTVEPDIFFELSLCLFLYKQMWYSSSRKVLHPYSPNTKKDVLLKQLQTNERKHNAYLSSINNIFDVGNCERSLGNIRGHNNQPTAVRGRLEHLNTNTMVIYTSTYRRMHEHTCTYAIHTHTHACTHARTTRSPTHPHACTHVVLQKKVS